MEYKALSYIWTQVGEKIHNSSSGWCFCASAARPAHVSTWALWCSPPYGCACTGRWTESSPAAEQHTDRQRYGYLRVRFVAFAATCWRNQGSFTCWKCSPFGSFFSAKLGLPCAAMTWLVRWPTSMKATPTQIPSTTPMLVRNQVSTLSAQPCRDGHTHIHTTVKSNELYQAWPNYGLGAH